MTSPSFPEDLFSQDLNDVFALLRPVNPSAQKAFHDVVSTVIEHPDEYVHVRHFMRLEPKGNIAADVYTEDEDSTESVEQEHQWNGTFVFSLGTRPRDSGEAWVLGTGRGLSADKGVDIMLAPASQGRSTGIAGRHALLKFHQESGRIVLQARHTIRISGPGTDLMTASDIRVLEQYQFVSFGHCVYAFEYTDFAKSETFRDEFSVFMKDHHGPTWTMHKDLFSALGW
ncbi:hypothetical protein MMC07_003723 [Pseudocyphellaria aurata]|nr:hypothetical protein [Pseudocyphellaria aurata]